ncbi:cysteine/serine-rich nuclear protein 2 isoform X1 [Carassius carassius]|uniref:cysteine/serine-rich nuclear protein 2 isoform X1 n=2 Tax=Carassius carassius TaxID=217509 RepID=UPI0028695602|nr:cysteine/serine-rich nuclear protein 2 isoform X1 [Carassius carassius]XP_059384177.1 cysteine/serine-rich nuclear protein 2 isoform X1 [Carassius carassius]
METVSSRGLKRRFEEVDSGSPCSTPKDSDDDISSSDSADSCDSLNAPSSSLTPPSILRRHKASLGRKQVRFDAVTVYYFSRRQGFTSVPSQGGSSLGMARHHCAIRHYTLGEFAREQESSHKHVLRQHLRQEKLNARKLKLTRNGTVDCPEAELLTLDDISDEDLDVESVEVDDCFFLQPLPTKRRRALLRASGIASIDAREKAELRAIRLSREECGCDCRFYCDPRHCGCCQAGIKCQVDRMSFPCGCTRDGCGNTAGRIEFNPLRVRTHYLHTVMKLDLEKRNLLGVRSGEVCGEETELVSSSSLSLSPLDSDVEVESQSIQELQEEQCDSLERENETAVLHLQSAEERERRLEQEEQQVEEAQTTDSTLCLLQGALTSQAGMEGIEGVEGVLLEGPFPEGTTLLCITENHADEQTEQRLLKDPASVLYYQVGHVETAAFETLPAQVEEVVSEGGDPDMESDRQKQETCGQDSAKSLSVEVPPPLKDGGEEHLCPEQASNEGECLETCLALDEKAVQLPPEV